MKPTTLFNALYVASALFLCFVNAALVLGFVTVNDLKSHSDGYYSFKDLRVEKEGVALFWNTSGLSTERKFINNGIYYQTVSESPKELNASCFRAAATYMEFSNINMNSGIFIYDYAHARSNPTFVALAKTLVNTGNMWFVVGALEFTYSHDVPDVCFLVSDSFRNFGYIEVSGSGSHVASFKLRRRPEPAVPSKMSFIVNRGHIRLRQTNLSLMDNIRGYGCISLTDGANLFLDDRIRYPKKQKIFFNPESTAATLHIAVHNGGKSFSQELSGFSSNCVIKFSKAMLGFEYRASSLFIWRMTKRRAYEFKIGPNYKSLSFKRKGKRFIYTEAAPKNVPHKCHPESYAHLMKPYLDPAAW